MSKSKYTRKLTAILSADVVGYSRLMGGDEEFTIQTLNTYRDLMTTLIEDYRGRVVDAVGDNLLAEFKSVVDAVQCAVGIQTKLKNQNEKLAVSRHMLFRIGINVGDIIQEKGRIYGDGVNIAARIESLTEPGGVSISRGAYDHIKKKLGFGYEYIGEHAVKNISDPVRVYKVLMEPKDAGKRIKFKANPLIKKSRLKKWLLRVSVSIALILSTVFAGVYWKYIYLPAPADIDPDSKMEFNLPEGPSIAVLPFVNMSKDPEQEYLCDGITENLISVLAQMPTVLVIARNSTFAYKDKSIDVRQIGQELGARYVVEGSIQKSDDRFRFVVQLIDTDTGLHIWAERYDREFKDIFKLQDEITLGILKAAGIKVVTQDQYPGIADGIGDIDSFIIFSKLYEFFQNPTKGRYARALKNAKEIITKNPEYPYRYDCLASVHLIGVEFGSCKSNIICIFNAAEAIKKSFSLNANNWWAHINLGRLFSHRKEYDKAILSYKKSIELNSNFADAYFEIGRTLIYSDKPEEALEYIYKAIRLNPVFPYYYLYNLGYLYSWLGQHEKAIKILKKCLKRQPDFWWAYATLAVSYSLSGQENNAKTAVRELLNLSPDYSIEFVKKNSPFKNQDKLNLRLEALRKAGVPEK